MILQIPKFIRKTKVVDIDIHIIETDVTDAKPIYLDDNYFLSDLEIEVTNKSDKDFLVLTHKRVMDNGKEKTLEVIKLEPSFKGTLLIKYFTKSFFEVSGKGVLKIKKIYK